jgi:glycosyltransferase involved in cell wall biosynthesis
MVKAFRTLGHTVKIISPVEGKRNVDSRLMRRFYNWVAKAPSRVIYEVFTLLYNVSGYWNLHQCVKEFHPDLIYERYSLNTFCGVWISARYKVPLVLEVNAPLFLEEQKLGNLKLKMVARFAERWICSHSSKTIVVTNVLKRILIDQGVPECKLDVMYNSVDLQRFNPSISGAAIRKKWGLKDKVVVGFIGWFREWHGLEILLRAAASRLRPENVRLLLVGTGPAYPKLRDYAKDLGISDLVVFTGAIKRDEVPIYIAGMDVCVQPDATEYACPMKIIEYMAMGKCIVAKNQQNIREILDDNSTGLLFKECDEEDLSEILIRTIKDAELRNRIGNAAYKKILDSGFTWQENAKQTLKLVIKCQ